VEFDVVIEIPKGTRNKYEMDHVTGRIRLDRMLFTATQYPTDYGFIPDTLADDGDPLDILVLMQEPVVPLTIVRARPVGGLKMRDDKGEDDKIVAVAVDDPAFNHYTSIAQLSPHLMIELERFFRDYKVLEAKTTEVDELYGRDQALAVMRRSLDSYRSRAGWRKP